MIKHTGTHASTNTPSQVGQLHHLVSTNSQPGVFNSPYAIATGSVPFIAGAPVEEHLKQVGVLCLGASF